MDSFVKRYLHFNKLLAATCISLIYLLSSCNLPNKTRLEEQNQVLRDSIATLESQLAAFDSLYCFDFYCPLIISTNKTIKKDSTMLLPVMGLTGNMVDDGFKLDANYIYAQSSLGNELTIVHHKGDSMVYLKYKPTITGEDELSVSVSYESVTGHLESRNFSCSTELSVSK